jgi:hypothetical protein
MQELNQDLLEEDDDLLADIPMSLLYTSPIRLTEEDLLNDTDFLLNDELPTEEELPAVEELSVEEEIPEPEFSIEDDLLLSDDELILEELIAEFHSEPQPEPVEPAPVKRRPAAKPEAVSEKADASNKDRSLIILMAVASFLSIGIICMLIYWMEAFLK